MEQPDTLPRILVVDNDPGRIEHLGNLLYHHGYQTITVDGDELAKGLEGQPQLVLSYLPLQPGYIAALDIPVVMVVPDVTAQQHGNSRNPAVVYLSESTGSGDLVDKIEGDFEFWIRSRLGSEFRWSARPRDTRENRQMVADSIVDSIEKNNGSFPQRNAFIERLES